MKKTVSNASIAKRTILLIFLLVFLPSIAVGTVFIIHNTVQSQKNEDRVIEAKLQATRDTLNDTFQSVEQAGRTLGADPSFCRVVQREESGYLYVNGEIEDMISRIPEIVKIQLIRDGTVVWSDGVTGNILTDNGYMKVTERIEKGEAIYFWSGAAQIPVLDYGVYSAANWFSSYYCPIYDSDNLEIMGVLGFQLGESAVRELYYNRLEGTPSASWIVCVEPDSASGAAAFSSDPSSGADEPDGSESLSGSSEPPSGGRRQILLSASDSKILEAGLPEEFLLPADAAAAGSRTVRYQGNSYKMYWTACEPQGVYLVQLDQNEGVWHTILLYMVVLSLIFGAFCLIFYTVYKKSLIIPLEKLADKFKKAQTLDLSPIVTSGRKDEIGLLADGYNEMVTEIDRLIKENYLSTIKTQQAEREAMLSQINPHFLYNTLDSIHWNALMNGDAETGEQLEVLSSLLQKTLNFGESHHCLSDELSIVEDYCYLLKARFRNEIGVKVEKDPGTDDYVVPKMIIQPLVENAYRHGVSGKIGDKQILVRIRKTTKRLQIYVADNGAGCDEKEIRDQIVNGIGKQCFALRNVHDRIELEYGGKGFFYFFSREGKGTIVKIFIDLSCLESS